MIKLEYQYDPSEIAVHLTNQLPGQRSTISSNLKLWNDYVDVMSKAIHKSIILARNDQIEENILPLPWEDIKRQLGYSMKHRKFYLHWFHEHYPLVKMLRLGKPGILTMIEPLANIKLASTSTSPKECFKEMYGNLLDEDSEIDWVSIDPRSLNAYIQANELQLDTTNKGQSYVDTLLRNLVWAKTIYLCAEYSNECGQGWQLPQIVNESLFGRRYYTGLNLQNAPKIVRHAALGSCYEYDLNASVFAWKLDLAHRELGISLKDLTYTIDYIDNKDKIRDKLAKNLKIVGSFEFKKKIIKDVITAIGFGARPTTKNACWYDSSGQLVFTAMSKIIKSPDARLALFNDPWMKSFANEQVVISKAIFDDIKSHVQNLEFLRNDSGNLSQNKVCAFLYQTQERAYIEELVKEAREQGSLLLIVHDAFYTKTAQKMVRLKEILKNYNSEADISLEEIRGYAFDPNIYDHKKFIIEEEQRATNYELVQGFTPTFSLKELEIRRQLLHLPNAHETTSQEYHAAEFNNGCRLDSEYDPELDPFYMDE